MAEEIGLLDVKGKVNKVPVFRILDEKPASKSDASNTGVPGPAPKNKTEFIGKKPETQTIA